MSNTNTEKIRLMLDLLSEHGGTMARREFVAKIATDTNSHQSGVYAFIKSQKAKAFGIHTYGEGQSAMVSLNDTPTGNNAGPAGGLSDEDAYVLDKVDEIRKGYIKAGKGDATRFSNVVLHATPFHITKEQWTENLIAVSKLPTSEQKILLLKFAFALQEIQE